MPKVGSTPNDLTKLCARPRPPPLTLARRFNYWLSSETEMSLAAKGQQISRLKRSVKCTRAFTCRSLCAYLTLA